MSCMPRGTSTHWLADTVSFRVCAPGSTVCTSGRMVGEHLFLRARPACSQPAAPFRFPERGAAAAGPAQGADAFRCRVWSSCARRLHLLASAFQTQVSARGPLLHCLGGGLDNGMLVIMASGRLLTMTAGAGSSGAVIAPLLTLPESGPRDARTSQEDRRSLGWCHALECVM